MASAPSMSWSEVRPGTYRRPTGDNEHFIKFVGDRAHPLGLEQWRLTAWARFKPADRQPADRWTATLREAWTLLRFQQPSIATTPGPSAEVLEYTVPDACELAHWMARSFFVEDDPSTDVNDLVGSLKPSAILTVHWLPSRREVVLHTPHWRTDAGGALQLLNALFACVATVLREGSGTQRPWGDEIGRLAPSVEDVLQLPAEAGREADAAARRYLDTLQLIANSVELPYGGDLTRPPVYPAHTELQLTPEATAALEQAAGKLEVSIYAAVHAAVAAVNLRKASPATRGNHYASNVRHSLRPHLPAPYDSPAFAAAFYAGCYGFQVSATDSFEHHAKQYEREYARGVDHDFLVSRRQYAKLLLHEMQSGPRPRTVGNIDVTCIDNADDLVQTRWATPSGPLEVLNIGVGLTTLTPQPFCFYWKFRGRLYLQLWYNRSYHDEETAEDVLQSIKDVLISELLSRP